MARRGEGWIRRMRLRPAGLVGQDGILRAGWQPALGGHLQTPAGGVPTRRRLATCPTSRNLPSLYFAGLEGLFLNLLHGGPGGVLEDRVRVEAGMVGEKVLALVVDPGVAVQIAQLHGFAGVGIAERLQVALGLGVVGRGGVLDLLAAFVTFFNDPVGVFAALGNDGVAVGNALLLDLPDI